MVLSIEADDVEPGATYSVALAVDGSTVRTWTGLSEPGVVSTPWTGAPGRTHEGVFTVVSTLGGRTWTRRYPFSFVLGARNFPLSTSSSIAGQVFRVGDRATVADATAAAVLGDGVATLDGQTVSMRHPGFTLLKDVEGGEHWFAVYEQPGGEGDVFLFDWTSGSPAWASAAWTKLTQNSDRTYPDHADDVAMIRVVDRGDYGYLTVPASGVTLGQLVVGMTKHWTLNHADGAVSPLRFERTDGGTPRYSVSFPSSTATGTYQMRVGEYDRDDGGNVLAISFAGPLMEVDLCGDSAAAAAYARKPNICFAVARSKFDVGEGQTLRVLGGSRNTGGNTDYFEIRGRLGSGVFGDGTLEMADVAMSCQQSADRFVKVGLYRSVEGFGPFDAENNVARFTTRFNTIPAVPIEILSAHCPTNLNPQTALANYWSVGVSNAWLSPSVLLSGCNYRIAQNGDYAPHWDFYDATNVAEKATIRGHVGLYGPPSYGRDNHKDSDGVQQGRVTHHVRFKNLALFDRWSTMQANGLNFNRGANTNDIKGTLRIDNWEQYVRRPPGVDPADYDHKVYAIIPWMTVHCNDNNQELTDTDWGQEQTFPGVREEDGCIRLIQSLANNADPADGGANLSQRGANDNFYFSSKPGFGLGGADRTLFSLVYCTQETPHYATGGNFYLDSSKGGHKLTITSGAMAITRRNKWLGQPADMTRNGRIVLQGDPSYLHVPSPGLTWPASGSAGGGEDYSMCWVPLVAEKDLVKGGAGSIGLAGDQRGIRGTLAVNGGELWLGYPAYKKHGYLYTFGNPTNGWPMHGCATDCDFVVRGGAVLSLASAGYAGLDSDGVAVDEPVLAWGRERRHTITLERSGNAVGGVYVAEGVEGVVYEALYETEDGEAVTFARGTWGSSESAADHVDDLHFAGPGVVKVQHDRCVRPTIMILR